VNPVVVVVVHVIANEPSEMLFVQRDDMVENLAAAASYPAFRGSVGKGRQLQVIVTLTIDLSRSLNHPDIEAIRRLRFPAL